VKIENLKTGSAKEFPAEGLFVAIGYEPNNELAKALGLDLDPEGYIKTDASQRTSMPMVYAAGDVTGSVKQIAVAVGQGAIAATSAFEDIGATGATSPRDIGAGSSPGGTATPQGATRPSDIGTDSTSDPWWAQ
jgi:pyruvate/2-oxoglutarate dehydrogenase complex dihydrolipoamide dehydrogenase (E3) component